MVTDSAGNEKDGKDGNVAPDVTPSGLSPAGLKAAYKVTGTGTGTIAIVDAYGYPNAEDAKPGFQTDPLCSNRTEADISAVADPATEVAVYGPTGTGTKSGRLVFGGTSVAAPLVGGIYATYNIHPQAAAGIWANRGVGQNDVTVRSNGTCGTSLCNAGVGYDGPTGWGTPNGSTGL